MRGKSRHIPSPDEREAKIGLVQALLDNAIEDLWQREAKQHSAEIEEWKVATEPTDEAIFVRLIPSQESAAFAHRAKYEAEYARIDARERGFHPHKWEREAPANPTDSPEREGIEESTPASGSPKAILPRMSRLDV